MNEWMNGKTNERSKQKIKIISIYAVLETIVVDDFEF